ncbi:MAG: exonuclease domain-containing protein [Isosphaeraceae bacterium]
MAGEAVLPVSQIVLRLALSRQGVELIAPSGLDCQYVAFDLETTGLVARLDRVVEIGAIRFERSGKVLDRFEQLVHPGRLMSPAAQAIHGISDNDLAGAPPAREVLPRFLEFLAEPRSTVLLAHNASFDAGFLGCELSRAGLPHPPHRVLDTLALARRCRPDLASHRLEKLVSVFQLGQAIAHRALADCLSVKDLWLHLGGPSFDPQTLVSYPIHDRSVSVVAPHGYAVLEEAIAAASKVTIEYEGGTRGVTPRTITPRRFEQKGGQTYVLAFCHLDRFEKSFRLDRIRCCVRVHGTGVTVVRQ